MDQWPSRNNLPVFVKDELTGADYGRSLEVPMPPDGTPARVHLRRAILTWSAEGGRVRASIRIWTWSANASVSFTARLRKGETVEAMVSRAIGEVERRTREGMPAPASPSATEQLRRRHRAAMAQAPIGRPS